MKRLKLISVVIFAAAIGGMLLHNHLHPVPTWLIGTWENDESWAGHGPGVVQLTISPDGTLDLAFTDAPGRVRGHHFLAPTQYRINVIGDTATGWHVPTGPSQTHKYRIKAEGDRLSICPIVTVPKGSVLTVQPKPVLWRRARERRSHVPLMPSDRSEGL